MVGEVQSSYKSQWAAIEAVAAKLGIGCAETLRIWVRQAADLRQMVKIGEFAPLPVRQRLIPKANGKTRSLGIAMARGHLDADCAGARCAGTGRLGPPPRRHRRAGRIDPSQRRRQPGRIPGVVATP
jgi:hypothetical protein